jgi:hypothetical protein
MIWVCAKGRDGERVLYESPLWILMFFCCPHFVIPVSDYFDMNVLCKRLALIYFICILQSV